MRFLLGIDNTDQPKSGGTCCLAYELGLLLQDRTGARLLEVTRHQLLHDPLVPYTTRNSAVCLVLDAEPAQQRLIELESRSFLLHQSAAGANAGMALADLARVSTGVTAWGNAAKHQLLTRTAALELARSSGIAAAGITGDGSGVIGALAAVGLRTAGNDGRFFWLPGLDELTGVLTLTQLLDRCPLGRVETLRGKTPQFDDRIDLGGWVRPLVRGGRSLLLVEQAPDPQKSEWRVIDKVRIRQLSE